MTAPRLAVLDALEQAGAHPDVERIAEVARERHGSLSLRTVYENLRVLADAGLARRFEPAGSPARFEARVGDNHHHLVCRSCGTAVDVDCVVGARPCLEPSDDAGFALDEAEVTFWGVCPACQSDQKRQDDQQRDHQEPTNLDEHRSTA